MKKIRKIRILDLCNAWYCKSLSVRLSVRQSVTRVLCDKTKETYAHILMLHERSFILVF